jgi:hypothetical protein
MQARASADDNRDTRRDTSTRPAKLDDCYGKIGIRAVAGAVHCRGKERKASRSRVASQELATESD